MSLLYFEYEIKIYIIKIKCCHYTIFLITSYLPAGNSADEIMRYSETLDEVYELTQKYATQGTVIWVGDLNGSLEAKRHRRDQLLQLYCSDVGYVPVAEVSTPTFYHNANSSTSRIDHILQLKSQERQVLEVCVRSREALNTSTHDPLIACINDKPSPNHNSTTMVLKAKKTMPHKINWEKVDVKKYKALIQVRVTAILDADITTPSADTTECILEKSNAVLYSTAAECAPPRNKPRTHDRKLPWSHTLKSAVAEAKNSFWVWKQADRTHSAVTDMKRTKRSLRSKQRQLKAQQRDAKHLEIMTASSRNKSLFYKLIHNQRGTRITTYHMPSINTAFLLSESIAEARDNKEILYTTLL